ncbi:hypothetical protein [Paraburkholderia mimosarum]|uniref:hypothetical protein n=1 Tax=Paraburkholderia mimosarum TaxID=312026 RepID=UPI00047F51C1|nr:hypothetical protein [Paraburkholderia mimosarum]
MKVRDMLHCLQNADPDAVVFYFASIACVGDVEEINPAFIVTDVRVCERRQSADGNDSSVYHATHHGQAVGWNPHTGERWPQLVVILTSESLQAADSDDIE